MYCHFRVKKTLNLNLIDVSFMNIYEFVEGAHVNRINRNYPNMILCLCASVSVNFNIYYYSNNKFRYLFISIFDGDTG